MDAVCPYYIHYGMTWSEFWYGPIDMFHFYWQKHQFDIEEENQKMWIQGLYIRSAVASCLDSKNHKYPSEPKRLTELTDWEKEIENKRRVEKMREQLLEIKRSWDARQKEGGKK